MKDVKGRWIIVSEQDARILIDHLNEQWKLPARILYWYGLRVSEILALTPADFYADLCGLY